MNVILVLISYTFNNTFYPRRKTKYFLGMTLLPAAVQCLYYGAAVISFRKEIPPWYLLAIHS